MNWVKNLTFSLILLFIPAITANCMKLSGDFETLEVDKGLWHCSLKKVKIKSSPRFHEYISFDGLELKGPFKLALNNGEFFVNQKAKEIILRGKVFLQELAINVRLKISGDHFGFIFKSGNLKIYGKGYEDGNTIIGVIMLPYHNKISFIYKLRPALFYLSFNNCDCEKLSFFLSQRVCCIGKMKGGILGLYKEGNWYVIGQISSKTPWLDLSLLKSFMAISSQRPYSAVTVKHVTLLVKGILPRLNCKLYLISPVTKFYSQWVVCLNLYDILKGVKIRRVGNEIESADF